MSEHRQNQGLVTSKKGPFVFRFETARHKYVYDVNTMRIVRVEAVVYDLIEDIGKCSVDEMFANHEGKYTREQIVGACEEIEASRCDKGLFSAERPLVKLPFGQEYIEEQIKTCRGMLILNVTENCNFRCTYCTYSGSYAGRREHACEDMTWEVAKAAIDDFIGSCDKDDQVVSFYGGEPLLNFDLVKRCSAYVRDSAIGGTCGFMLTTNGSLLDDAAGDYVAKENFMMKVSLDGPQELHDRYRRTQGGGPTWETVTENVRRFLDRHPEYRQGGRLAFGIVAAGPLDVREIQRFVKECDLFSSEININISFVNPVGYEGQGGYGVEGLREMYESYAANCMSGRMNEERDSVELKLEDLFFGEPFLRFHKRYTLFGGGKSKAVSGKSRRSDSLSHNVMMVDKIDVEPDKSGERTYCTLSVCIPGVRRTFVSVDGRYLLCERVPESDCFCIGDVHRGLDSEKIYGLLDGWVRASDGECQNCWCVRTCQVGCWAVACDVEKAMTEEVKAVACEAHRKHFSQVIRDYCAILEKNPHAFDYMKEITIK